MVYLYNACDQISDFCHQQLLRKMRQKISWKDGQTDRGKTVYPPAPSGSGGIITIVTCRNQWWYVCITLVARLIDIIVYKNQKDNLQITDNLLTHT
jgi:hypothetical protein